MSDGPFQQEEQRWLTHDDLTDVERRLLASVEFGSLVDATQSDGSKGTVRSRFLFQILTGAGDLGPAFYRRLRLANAAVAGQIDLTGSTLRGAVEFTDCDFDERVLLDNATARTLQFEGCHLPAGVSADGVHIDGDLSLSGSRCAAPEADHRSAVDLDQALITGSLDCRREFRAEGEVRLLGAQIGGQVVLTGCTFHNPGRDALSMDRARIAGDLFCQSGFQAEGEVRLPGARIGGQVGLKGGSFHNKGRTALDMEQATASALFFSPASVEGYVGLGYAEVKVLVVREPSEAPSAGLSGMQFAAVYPGPTGPSARDPQAWITWFANPPEDFTPSPYGMLAAAYSAAGHEEEAKRVRIAGQDARYAHARRRGRWWSGLWGWLKKWTVGYGYRPARAIWWLIGYWLIGSLVLALGWDALWDGFRGEWRSNPFAYFLDLMIPFLDLPQNKAIRPVGGTVWLVIALVVVGWVLVTAAIAGITSALTRKE